VQLGLYFDLRNPPQWRRDWSRVYGFTLEMCEEAEHLGIDSLWFSEHHGFEDGYLTQPLTFASAVAARTRSARLGTAILIAPFRSAAQITEEATVVDLVSNGRLDLGLGAGYRVPEFGLFGADLARRYETTDSRVREIRALLASDETVPKPVQQRLPIWLGYQGPRGARRAGLLGEGLLSANATLVEPYVAGLIEGGHDPSSARMAGMIQAWVTDDAEREWPLVSEHLAYQIDSYRRYTCEGPDHPRPRPIDPERLRTRAVGGILDYFVYGDAVDVASRISDTVGDATVETVFLWASIAGMPEEIVAGHIRRLCTDLRPRLQAVDHSSGVTVTPNSSSNEAL